MLENRAESEGNPTIAIVGVGNMGGSLLRGLRRGGEHRLVVATREAPTEIEPSSDEVWIRAADAPGASALGAEDAVVLATKPKHLEDALATWWPVLAPAEGPGPVLISLLAGVPTGRIEALLPPGTPVVRAMPNIAATVDHAATAVAPGRAATAAHVARAEAIFASVGRSWAVPEEHLDAVTGLSGSGPAYLYMVIEALSDGGVKMGLPRDLALALATQTVVGAGRLVQETTLHPAILRDQVTTPGGTTIAAIHELEERGLRSMLISAVVTATERSAALAGPPDGGDWTRGFGNIRSSEV